MHRGEPCVGVDPVTSGVTPRFQGVLIAAVLSGLGDEMVREGPYKGARDLPW